MFCHFAPIYFCLVFLFFLFAVFFCNIISFSPSDNARRHTAQRTRRYIIVCVSFSLSCILIGARRLNFPFLLKANKISQLAIQVLTFRKIGRMIWAMRNEQIIDIDSLWILCHLLVICWPTIQHSFTVWIFSQLNTWFSKRQQQKKSLFPIQAFRHIRSCIMKLFTQQQLIELPKYFSVLRSNCYKPLSSIS